MPNCPAELQLGTASEWEMCLLHSMSGEDFELCQLFDPEQRTETGTAGLATGREIFPTIQPQDGEDMEGKNSAEQQESDTSDSEGMVFEVDTLYELDKDGAEGTLIPTSSVVAALGREDSVEAGLGREDSEEAMSDTQAGQQEDNDSVSPDNALPDTAQQEGRTFWSVDNIFSDKGDKLYCFLVQDLLAGVRFCTEQNLAVVRVLHASHDCLLANQEM